MLSVRPKVAELSFQLFGRALHPELFEVHKSRTIERAEYTARLLDTCFFLDMDLRGVSSGPRELHWTSLAAILQQIVPAHKMSGQSPQATMITSQNAQLKATFE